jgi:site-specific recombinase
MERANPFASWRERANWMIDVAEWIRQERNEWSRSGSGMRRTKQQRVRILLDWLDANRDTKRVVQTTLQKTLREAGGAELFFTTGLPREPAFFSEMSEKFLKFLLPKAPAQLDLSGLFLGMFSEPGDAEWLLGLDHKTLTRLWKLCADDGIAHAFLQQIDEALIYLVTVILSVGISPAFRQRLDPSNSLQATPFMALRRELERYLQSGRYDEAALRSVRMLIAVCQAQTDRIYAHLDENGVSVGLVYSIERMRAQLARMARLIDLRAATTSLDQGADQIRVLLGDMIAGHSQRSSVRGLFQRSFALLTRKMVERNASYGFRRGEQPVARNTEQYRAMLKAGALGGVVSVFTVLGALTLTSANFAHFFEGLFASLNYILSFTAIALVGGAIAGKQPAVTAPALATKIGELDNEDGMHALMSESAGLLRAQAAAAFGNLATLIPVMILASVGLALWPDVSLMSTETAQATLGTLSAFGSTAFFAVVTGILLWISGLAACVAENWFALRRLRESLAHHRRSVHVLGAARAERWAGWLERNVASIVGNICLAGLFGMVPVFARFFGMHLEIRHVTFAFGSLIASASTLGWHIVESPGFWLATGATVLIGVLNIGVAFTCSMILALRTCAVPTRARRLIFKTILKRFLTSPGFFLFAGKGELVAPAGVSIPAPTVIEHKKRSKGGM